MFLKLLDSGILFVAAQRKKNIGLRITNSPIPISVHVFVRLACLIMDCLFEIVFVNLLH